VTPPGAAPVTLPVTITAAADDAWLATDGLFDRFDDGGDEDGDGAAGDVRDEVEVRELLGAVLVELLEDAELLGTLPFGAVVGGVTWARWTAA
jgi:hypothetical protein